MKKWYIAIMALIVLSFAASAILIPMMPDTVPAHYNAAGEADRMGSRYETLIFPLITLLMGAFMIIFARKRKDASEEKPLLIVGTATTALFLIIGIFFSVRALTYSPSAEINADINRILLVIMGLFIIFAGNIMPKVRMNSAFGLRTPWSMKDEETWRKSQRFGGISGVICGLVMILCAIFTGGITAAVVMLVIVLAWAVICTVMSYKYANERP